MRSEAKLTSHQVGSPAKYQIQADFGKFRCDGTKKAKLYEKAGKKTSSQKIMFQNTLAFYSITNDLTLVYHAR